MAQVTDYLRHRLRLEASPEKSKVSKASKGTMFLGYTVITVTGSRVRRTKLGRRVVRSRDCADRIHLRVPHDRLVRFNQRKGYGDLGRLKAMHRRYLVDSSMLEIVLAYNAEMRGLANYYRLPSVLTATAIIAATLTIRPPWRTFILGEKPSRVVYERGALDDQPLTHAM